MKQQAIHISSSEFTRSDFPGTDAGADDFEVYDEFETAVFETHNEFEIYVANLHVGFQFLEAGIPADWELKTASFSIECQTTEELVQTQAWHSMGTTALADSRQLHHSITRRFR
jgi:hypothetical protein